MSTNPYGVRPPTRLDSSAFADWNAANQAARREHDLHPIAFAVDRLCETCQTARRDHTNRKCAGCRSQVRRAA